MDGFPDSEPDIEQTDAGDCAANEVDFEKCAQFGHADEDAVVGPQPCPRQDSEQHSELDAENDIDNEGQPMQPESYLRMLIWRRFGRDELRASCLRVWFCGM